MDRNHVSIEQLTIKHLSEAARVVAEAYYNNPLPLVAFDGHSDASRLKKVTRVYTGVLRSFIQHGRAYVVRRNGRVVAVCGARPPVSGGIKAIRWAMKASGVLTCGLKAISSHAAYERVTKQNRPNENHWYLTFIGVQPKYRGEGIGHALVSHICKLADAEKVPVFIETTVEDHIKFYEDYNFSVTNQVTVAGNKDFHMWAMVRPAKN